MNEEQQQPKEVVMQNNREKDNTFFEDEKKKKTIIMRMPPDVKEFYIEFKKNNPGREDEYYKAFVNMKQKEIQKGFKEEEEEKRLAERLAKKDSFWQIMAN